MDFVEIDTRRVHALRKQGAARSVTEGDFLDLDPMELETGYRRVVMNPPFAKAIDHVMHALGFMDDGGTLVAVMPEYITWHTDRATREFRELVAAADGEIKPLPDNSFKTSGTEMRTVLLVLDGEPGGPLPPTAGVSGSPPARPVRHRLTCRCLLIP